MDPSRWSREPITLVVLVALLLGATLPAIALQGENRGLRRTYRERMAVEARVHQMTVSAAGLQYRLDQNVAALRHLEGLVQQRGNTPLARTGREGINLLREDLQLLRRKVDEQRRQLLAKGTELARWQAQAVVLQLALEARQLRRFARLPQTADQVTLADGVFRVCPVDPPRTIADDFGAPRYTGGYHPHAGNDILAPMGTPIRAPFDGVATDATNTIGGQAVRVEGADGYVYNAHLQSFGTLGRVSAGEIVGYVGDSGNAQGGPPHDHFEWHPDQVAPGEVAHNGAVDPHPYLEQACGS